MKGTRNTKTMVFIDLRIDCHPAKVPAGTHVPQFALNPEEVRDKDSLARAKGLGWRHLFAFQTLH